MNPRTNIRNIRNTRFQQATTESEDIPAPAVPRQKSSFSSTGGGLLNALFGNKRTSTKPNCKSSRASSIASSPSRESSGGRSTAFPPKRISFDEIDFGTGQNQEANQGGSLTRNSNTPRGGASMENRPDDHSSGTTDPPDDDSHEQLNDFDDRISTRSDHGSDTSGPDSPDEVQLDDELVLFMRQFVEQIFQNTKIIDQDEKNKFCEYVRSETGRLWFARFINSQRINYSSKIDEGTFYRLVQYCAIVLFECYQEEDYGPAKLLMNICFTFYKEVPHGSTRRTRREFLYHHLRKQAIWHSLKFWNAAYFDAMQAERAKRAQREQWTNSERTHRNPSSDGSDDFVYKTLCVFTNNMRAFQVSKDSVAEFLRKQSNTVTLEQFRSLREQLESMYR